MKSFVSKFKLFKPIIMKVKVNLRWIKVKNNHLNKMKVIIKIILKNKMKILDSKIMLYNKIRIYKQKLKFHLKMRLYQIIIVLSNKIKKNDFQILIILKQMMKILLILKLKKLKKLIINFHLNYLKILNKRNLKKLNYLIYYSRI